MMREQHADEHDEDQEHREEKLVQAIWPATSCEADRSGILGDVLYQLLMMTTQCSTIVEDDVPSEVIDYMLARGC